jgi:hypothetical protein
MGPRNNLSPAARRAGRQRAQAAGLEMLERESKLRRERTERLRKLRLARDEAEKK